MPSEEPEYFTALIKDLDGKTSLWTEVLLRASNFRVYLTYNRYEDDSVVRGLNVEKNQVVFNIAWCFAMSTAVLAHQLSTGLVSYHIPPYKYLSIDILPRQLLPIILVHTRVVFPARHKHVEKTPISLPTSLPQDIQNGTNTSFYGEIGILTAQVGPTPLFIQAIRSASQSLSYQIPGEHLHLG
jgi:hypothetical protein